VVAMRLAARVSDEKRIKGIVGEMRYTNWHLYLLYKFTPSLLTYLLWRIWLLCGYLEPFAYLLWAPMAMTRGFF